MPKTDPLTRYRADLVIPAGIRAECAVLKAVAAHFVMSGPERQLVMSDQREVVRELVQATLDLVRGLGLANTITDDTARRHRIQRSAGEEGHPPDSEAAHPRAVVAVGREHPHRLRRREHPAMVAFDGQTRLSPSPALADYR